MAKIQQSDALDLILLSKAEAKIGQVVSSMLTLTQFQNEHLGTWQLMDGGSCAGTAYATLTGNTTVPNALTDGTFLRQAKAGRSLGSFEADDNKAHSHAYTTYNGGATGTWGAQAYQNNVNAVASQGGMTTSGGSEARPKNLAVNMFIKVGY